MCPAKWSKGRWLRRRGINGSGRWGVGWRRGWEAKEGDLRGHIRIRKGWRRSGCGGLGGLQPQGNKRGGRCEVAWELK